MRQHGHDAVSTFGLGADLPRDTWKSVLRQLLAMGYVTVDAEGFGGMMLTEAARPVLTGAEPLHLRRDTLKRSSSAAKGPDRKGTVIRFEGRDAALFQALKAWRLDQAKTQDLPPYVILHDSTLIDLVRERPKTRQHLSRLPGIGERKLDRYGADLLRLVAEG